MKKVILFSMFFVSLSAFAAEGTVKTAPNRGNSKILGISIFGAAASDISDRLTSDKVKYARDPFSGQLVQDGRGVRCIKVQATSAPYCYLAIQNGSID